MAGVTPTFRTEWTKKDKKTTSVPGSTYEDMFKFFQKKNAAKEEWAKFSTGRPDLSFKPASGDPVTEVVLKIGYTTTMPTWSKAGSLGKSRKAAWDKMIAALAKHEETHRAILLEQVALFGNAIEGETDLTKKKLAELFAKLPRDIKAAQDAYDSRTSHGVKEGVFLPAPGELED